MVPASDQRPAPVVVTPLSPPFPSRRRTDGRTATATAGQETGPGRPTFRVSKPRALLRLPSRNRAVNSLWPWPWPGVGERVTELPLQSHACLAPRTCTSTTALWHVEGGTHTTSSPHPLIWKHHGRRQRGPPSSHSHSHSHTPADEKPTCHGPQHTGAVQCGAGAKREPLSSESSPACFQTVIRWRGKRAPSR